MNYRSCYERGAQRSFLSFQLEFYKDLDIHIHSNASIAISGSVKISIVDPDWHILNEKGVAKVPARLRLGEGLGMGLSVACRALPMPT